MALDWCDPEFGFVCRELLVAQAALKRWQGIDGRHAGERSAEYQQLVMELEDELLAKLKQALDADAPPKSHDERNREKP